LLWQHFVASVSSPRVSWAGTATPCVRPKAFGRAPKKKKKRGEKCQCGVVIENCSFEEDEGVRKKSSVARGWVVCP
jgi:hypothetical protein